MTAHLLHSHSSPSYTNSINDCNTSLGKDATPVATTGGTPATRWLMNRVSTNGLFVASFFQIGITLQDTSQRDSVAWI
ncbi:hypothetical protein [Nostoc sp. PCC 9305]|uniref:hypothetical protein n=1 Tax=Nostoc sp. PCC 9305 TaxID=296636 RepID=UPI0039C608B1